MSDRCPLGYLFTIFGRCGCLGNVAKLHETNTCSLHMQFEFDWLSYFFSKRCLKIMVIYMYIVPGQWQTTSWVPVFYIYINIQSLLPFGVCFSPFNDFRTIEEAKTRTRQIQCVALRIKIPGLSNKTTENLRQKKIIS